MPLPAAQPALTRALAFEQALAQAAASIADVEAQVEALNEAQAGDTKSSAGDKFETSREMLQQSLDQLGAQLAVLQQHRLRLELAFRQNPGSQVSIGCFLRLGATQLYLIATGQGKVRLPDGQTLFVISADSPLGAALLGHTNGGQVVHRGEALALQLID